MQKKKTIALTYGDPKGIGLEILNKLIAKGSLTEFFSNNDFVIFGSADLIDIPTNQKAFIQVHNIPNLPEESGAHSFLCLDNAIDFCLKLSLEQKNNLAGLVTGPISKERWAQAGHKWTGQTELLGFKSKCSPEMLFVAKDWKVLLLTRHIALKDVVQTLSKHRFESAVLTLKKFLKEKYSLNNPKIALAGLNPHAGDNGEIGTEEIDYLKAWCEEFKIEGPFSPDDIWIRSSKDYLQNNKQEFDAYLAPYHDQVLPLIKTITNFEAVNISIGLPFLRTSPDHGTAFHLVGTGKADCKPFLEAIKLCSELS